MKRCVISFWINFPLEGMTRRNSREKSIIILMHIWLTAPSECEILRQEGLAFITMAYPTEGRLPIHWGMVTAVYPFLGWRCCAIGRLLRLQMLSRLRKCKDECANSMGSVKRFLVRRNG